MYQFDKFEMYSQDGYATETRKSHSFETPFIYHDPDIKGPVIVTDDWYVETEKKQMYDRAKTLKEYQLDMMDLIARRDLLRARLSMLEPGDPRDAEKIVEINIELRNINVRLDYLHRISGVNLYKLDHGTRFARFANRVKKKVSKTVKKIKKWALRNIEPICGIIASMIPIVGSIVALKIAKA